MSLITAAIATPPYRGPASFTRNETLYGRDREAQELTGLLISERIVLLYSPSGAGKTSLVQAKVIPELERREFSVLPVLRVSRTPPGTAGNRYLNSVALSLQGEAGPGLGAGSIEALLGEHPGAGQQDAVLIFDQFEEILTLDPTDIAAKREFFQVLGRALLNRGRWALFSMREDYVAALDPYLRYIPTRLSATFRLDLLGERAAGQAIAGPARERGVSFEPAAVQRLVDDLRRVQVQGPDGKVDEQPGPYVEPVQLQVVCLRLWREWAARRGPDDFTITAADLSLTAGGEGAELGASESVGEALRAYYDESLARLAAGPEGEPAPARERLARERALRDFFDRHLITADGVRGQVLQGFQATEGLANAALRELVDAYLVRSERRGGRTWYELAHDRLIRPVRASNDQWKREHLVPAQTQAVIWDDQGRPDGLLLRGEELRAAEAWAAGGDAVVTQVEREFLAECRALAEAEARERRRNRLIRALAVVASVVAVLAATAAVLALIARNEAAARQLAGQSEQALAGSAPGALLLAHEAAGATAPLDPLPASVASLYASLATTGGTPLVAGRPLRSAALSAAGDLAAGAGDDGEIFLWATGGAAAPRVLRGHRGLVGALAFSPDGLRLASAGDDGSLRVWDLTRPDPQATLLAGGGAEIRALAYSPDGAWLVAGDFAGRALAFRAGDAGAAPVELSGHSDLIAALAFSPDSRLLATASYDGTAQVWELAAPSAPLHTLADHGGTIYAVAFSPDGATLATGSEDGTARLWDVGSGASTGVLTAGEGVSVLAFSPDGATLATSGPGGTVRLWALATPDEPARELRGHGTSVSGLAFSPDGATLYSASQDWTLRAWRVDRDGVIVLGAHEGPIQALAQTAGSLATASADGTVRLWPTQSLSPIPWLRGPLISALSVAFSPDGRTISAYGGGGSARWEVAGATAAAAPLPALGDVLAAAAARDGQHVATVDGENRLRLWDAGRPEAPPVEIDRPEAPVVLLAVSPDARQVAAALEDGTLRLYPADGTAAARVVTTEGPYSALAFDPSGQRLAAGGLSGLVQLWALDQPDAAPVTRAGHGTAVLAIAFSPDGAALASGDVAGVTRLWRSGRGLTAGAALRAPDVVVQALAFSPDGATLAVGASDNVIRLWRVAQPADGPLLVRGQAEGLSALAFSPDGATLAAGDAAGRVRLWPLDVGRLAALACAHAGRNLTLAEWQGAFRDAPYRRTCPSLPVSPSLIDTAAELALLGDLAGAGALERQVRALDAAGEIPARSWGRYCRAVALGDEPRAALPACDAAVAGDPGDGRLSDWRALARARAGDRAGAAEDLRAYLAWAEAQGRDDDRAALRRGWLAALETGGDPYDQSAIATLRAEGVE